MAETSTIFGFMKYVSATDILSDFKKTVDSHFVNSLKGVASCYSFTVQYPFRFEPLRITISCCCNLFSMRLIVERDKFN